jgi:DNA-binding beta-propeller fold protein YncE
VFYGFGVNPEIIVRDLGFPSDLSVDPNEGKVYWVDQNRNQILRANWDGSAVETLVDSNLHPSSLTLDLSARKIYWVDFQTDSIERSDFDGSNRVSVLTVFAASRIDIGPDGPVGIDQRRWGQVKQMYRSP